MLSHEYSLYHALIGGILIGIASLIATAASGKIPGISGICARILVPATTDKTWRLTFLLGLIIGALIAFQIIPAATQYTDVATPLTIIIAGILVGIGTRVGGGCTSGHGVCGIGMGAKDSIIATLTFMVAAILTVLLVNQF